jgi:hypothetical protein
MMQVFVGIVPVLLQLLLFYISLLGQSVLHDSHSPLHACI